SDPAFLQAVHARLALITVGLHNDYGHPAPELLAELRRLGVPARRTDLDGDIAVVLRAGQPVAVLHPLRVTASAARSPPAGVTRWPARLQRPVSYAHGSMQACHPRPNRPAQLTRLR